MKVSGGALVGPGIKLTADFFNKWMSSTEKNRERSDSMTDLEESLYLEGGIGRDIKRCRREPQA